MIRPAKNVSCLVLACGNQLRADDGVGPWLARWAADRFADDKRVAVVAEQQWTPEITEEIAQAQTAIFVDCSVANEAGAVSLEAIEPAQNEENSATHHLGAPQLLALALLLYGSAPTASWALTIGAASLKMGGRFSPAVEAALPGACRLLEEAILRSLASSPPDAHRI